MLRKDQNLRDVLKDIKSYGLLEKSKKFSEFIEINNNYGTNHYFREIISEQDRTAIIRNNKDNTSKEMLMFGSNNYLNLANDERIIEAIEKSNKKYGLGIGGPPMLNGYTEQHRKLEEKLSHMKGTESTMLYSSGYSANLAIGQTLSSTKDIILYDEYSHASLIDGFNKGQFLRFKHNDIDDLKSKIESSKEYAQDTFVCVEGIYSMDGDSAPLDKIVNVTKRSNAILILDDAHGLGTCGINGHGTTEHYGVTGEVDIIMGTFSKALGMSGGFISSSNEIITYLKYFARPYVFSASMPTFCVAAILETLNILEREPERRFRLLNNVKYAHERLKQFNIVATPEAGIISLRIPQELNIRDINQKIHNRGVFLNSIEYPAVPIQGQRLRISFMSNHTESDIDYLSSVLTEVLK